MVFEEEAYFRSRDTFTTLTRVKYCPDSFILINYTLPSPWRKWLLQGLSMNSVWGTGLWTWPVAYGWTKQSVSFNRRGQIPLLLLPQFPEFPWAQLCAMSHFQPQSEQARVGPNGKHTFLITGPLTDFLLSNVNPEQWKTNSSRKLGAMNYRIPNKYVSEGNDHLTILREGVAGHGWLLCFFFQGMWALFLYIVLCLGVLPWSNSWLSSDDFFCLLPPCHFSVWSVPVLPVGIKKILGERISHSLLPLAVVALGCCSPCLPQFSLWIDTDLSHSIHIV